MGVSKEYKTNVKAEVDGIYFQYTDDTRVLVARAGGSNKRYLKSLRKHMAKYKRLADVDKLSIAQTEEVTMAACAEAIVCGWETLINGEWVSGIAPEDVGENPEGNLLPATPDNVLRVFNHVPDIFTEIQKDAQRDTLYRQHTLEQQLGN